MSFQCKQKPNEIPVYKSKDGHSLAVGMEPEWMKLPKELGGRKVNVKEVFTAKVCKCGKHPAKIYILNCDFMVVECKSGYMWMNAPLNVEEFKNQMI